MLRVENLSLETADGSPVWDVSFHVPAGSIAGIVGPQGCGKSTLLRILTGLLPATHGQAFLGDTDLVRDPGWARRRTGYVAEDHGFYEEMSVAEYLGFMAACHQVPAPDQAALVQDLLAVVDLTDVKDLPVGALSRGMRQRLAVARALVHDPDLLILDEPFTGMDPAARVEIRDLLLELKEMGKAVLLCTSDVATLDDLVTYVGLMNGGRVVAYGSREEILALGERTRVIEIRVSGDAEPAAELLRTLPLVRGAVAEGALVRVSYLGGDGTVQSVLASLVRGGVPIVAFEAGRGGLAEALRQITEG